MKISIWKRFLSLCLSILLAAGMTDQIVSAQNISANTVLPAQEPAGDILTAQEPESAGDVLTAQEPESAGDVLPAAGSTLQVQGGTAGTDYTYDNGVLTILTGTPMTLSGTSTTDRIIVQPGIRSELTFLNLSIKSSQNRPFDMSGAEVLLHLNGSSRLESANFHTALYCPKGSALTIEGPGTLEAVTDQRGGSAAIGSESLPNPGNADYRYWNDSPCGSITINSGTVNASCPLLAAHASFTGAAIGGYGGGPITINGGIVNAVGDQNTVGIGSLGWQFEGINIHGGTVTAKTGGISMDDMGASTAFGPAIGITQNSPDEKGKMAPITITGGTISAVSGFGCAGIGGGRNGYGGNITITGTADVTARAGFGAAGIGGGYAQNGGGCGGVITIDGDAVVRATAGENAAGIGGGSPRQTARPGQPSHDGHSGIITIAGNARVTARGGTNSPGIGSGGPDPVADFNGASVVEKIVIMDNAVIDAAGGKGSPCDIGPGNLKGSNPSPEDRFQEYICTVPKLQTQVKAQNSLTIDENGNFTVTGNVTLNRNFHLPDGKTITLTEGSVLTVPDNITFSYPASAILGSGRLDQAVPAPRYLLTIVNGSGGGTYSEGEQVSIQAETRAGKSFVKWELTGPGRITDASQSAASFVMGAGDAVLTAVYRDGEGPDDRPDPDNPAPPNPDNPAPPNPDNPAPPNPDNPVPPNPAASVKIAALKLHPSKLTLKKGAKSKLKSVVTPGNASNKKLQFSSSNKKCVTVDQSGRVTAKAYGTAVITAKSTDGSNKKASCKVTVGYPVSYKLNGGKNHPANPAVFYKQKVTLKQPQRRGYLFQGWYTDKKFKKKITGISKNTKKSITVYAKWKKISLKKTTVSSLTSPGSGKLNIICKKVNGADGFELVYTTDKKFKKNVKRISFRSASKNTAKTIARLKKNTRYYVKVRAYCVDSAKKKTYGPYSTVKSIKTR